MIFNRLLGIALYGGIALSGVQCNCSNAKVSNNSSNKKKNTLQPVIPSPPPAVEPTETVSPETPVYLPTDEQIAAAKNQGYTWLAEMMEKIKAGEKVDINQLSADTAATTALHQAVSLGKEEIIQLLLAQSADINVTDSQGNTPLHQAVQNGNTAMAALLLEQDGINQEIKNYVKATSRPHHLSAKVDFGGYTPLHLAVLQGDKNMVELLVQAGADLKTKEANHEYTALHLATVKRDLEMVRLLLNEGADPKLQSQLVYLYTPLHIAASLKDRAMLQLLLAYPDKIDLEAKANHLHTTLDLAVMRNDLESVQLLYNHGAKVGEQNNGFYSLREAAGRGNLAMVQLLLQLGAKQGLSVDAKSKNDDSTALHWAAEAGHLDIVNFLLQEGANPNLPSKFDGLPLHMAERALNTRLNLTPAEKNNYQQIIDLFKKYAPKP